jgi:hypothetical protein
MPERRIKPDYDERFTLDMEGEEAVRNLLGLDEDGVGDTEDEDS